ncbi:hypothetical protein [Micromonospora sp. NBC_01813]|uniref:hypothetical protein n=1 Tax=Micromonospora sp. NBC_01813 TaxID=2975988 RepID=UPI002DD9C0CD|nr:hypothetical protein [Micromonospora sp. NBC_01813]WSA06844.1 hypothetical protein OG958_21515 [Micromonospora sp. NBC_01813]
MTAPTAVAVGIILLAIAILNAGNSVAWAYAKYRARRLLTAGLLVLAAVIILRHHTGEPE